MPLPMFLDALKISLVQAGKIASGLSVRPE
jgi:hypothetical protein